MLPFTSDVLVLIYEQYNRAAWPGHIAMLLLLAGAALLVALPGPNRQRLVAAILAVAWAWTAYGFHYDQFATVNFVAPLFALLFAVQALLLIVTGVVRQRMTAAEGPPTRLLEWLGIGVALQALVGDPLERLAYGWSLESLPVAGMAPGQTALFTLGLLLALPGRAAVHLAAIPLLWALIDGAMAWVLLMPQDFLQSLLGVGAFAAILVKNRRAGRA